MSATTKALAELRAALARADAAAEALASGVGDDEAADLALLARAEAENAGHPAIPAEVADRLFDGENPVKVFREWQGIRQNDFAGMIGISQGFLSETERSKTASAQVYRTAAAVLRVDLDLLAPPAPMKVYRLTPINAGIEEWERSTWRGTATVRAPTESAARWAADRAFTKMARKRRGGRTLLSPWLEQAAVRAEEIEWPDGAEGPVEILDPPHYNDALAGFDL